MCRQAALHLISLPDIAVDESPLFISLVFTERAVRSTATQAGIVAKVKPQLLLDERLAVLHQHRFAG